MITYQEYKDFIALTVNPHDNNKDALANWTMGMMGEIAEIQELLFLKTDTLDNTMHIVEECGDVFWYITMLHIDLGIDPVHSNPIKQVTKYFNIGVDYYKEMIIYGGRVCEQLKHSLMYNQQLDVTEVQNNLWLVTKCLHQFLLSKGANLDLAARLNVAKLTYRYNLKQANGGYSSDAVTHRHRINGQFKKTKEYKLLFEEITTTVLKK